MRIQEVPPAAGPLLERLVASFRDTLACDLVGVYLHGSLAMGCFNPASSDLDVLVVAERKLSIQTRRRIGRELVGLSDHAPPGGIELSVLTRAALRGFVHPLPFELHFSGVADDYASGRVDLTRERTDPDLAAHLTVTRRRGVALWGEPIAAVIPEVPWRDYLASILADAAESRRQVLAGPDTGEGGCRVPRYAVLNACRVLAAAEEGLVLSKREGAAWALPRLSEPHRRIVEAALRVYATAVDEPCDPAALKTFVTEMHERTRLAVGS